MVLSQAEATNISSNLISFLIKKMSQNGDHCFSAFHSEVCFSRLNCRHGKGGVHLGIPARTDWSR